MGSSEHPMFTLGVPPDQVAFAALVLSVACLFVPASWLAWTKQTKMALGALSISAALLSLGYFHFYLGGFPRVIDATTYLLEARTIAEGSFSFEAPTPTSSFRGRFLIHTAQDDARLAAIFPPGYPALLSLGVLLGAPECIGALLAAGLVVVTFGLTMSLCQERRTALVAAGLSVLNGCLRYHTAETMSHGWAALLATTALWSSVEVLRPAPHKKWWILLGASLGWLLATRQLTGVLFALGCGAVVLFARKKPKRSPEAHPADPSSGWMLASAAAIPGFLLLLSHHYAISGSIFESPQGRYYDLADGPGRCFGWGLGHGCGYEHESVVAEQGGQGLTWFWALLNTVHRLHWHVLDVANCEPLVLLGIYSAWRARGDRRIFPLLGVLLLVPLGYSLFYFNGSYPGAGARFYSELIPGWHALIALGASRLGLERIALFGCLFGFSVHASYSHRALRSAHFGPDAQSLSALSALPVTTTPPHVRRSSTPAVVLFSSAHAFNLARESDPGFVAARNTFDDRPRFLKKSYPEASFFRFESDGPRGMLEAIELAPASTGFSWESEFDFPPLSADGLWAHPRHLPLDCVSHGRALEIHREGPTPRLTLELPAFATKNRPTTVVMHYVQSGRHCRKAELPFPTSTPSRLLLELERWPELSHIDRLTSAPPP